MTRTTLCILVANQCIGSFTLPDSDSDSDLDSKPYGYIVLCRTCFHWLIQIWIPYRNGYCTHFGDRSLSQGQVAIWHGMGFHSHKQLMVVFIVRKMELHTQLQGMAHWVKHLLCVRVPWTVNSTAAITNVNASTWLDRPL